MILLENDYENLLNPFHVTGLFLNPMKTSETIERDQRHEMDQRKVFLYMLKMSLPLIK